MEQEKLTSEQFVCRELGHLCSALYTPIDELQSVPKLDQLIEAVNNLVEQQIKTNDLLERTMAYTSKMSGIVEREAVWKGRHPDYPGYADIVGRVSTNGR